MKLNLAKTLYNKGLIRPDVEIETSYTTTAIGNINEIKVSGCFMIREIINENDKMKLLVSSVKDGHSRIVDIETVTSIDGMEPNRFAEVYDIKDNGENKDPVPRRGRKPKDRSKPIIFKILS